MRLAVCFLISIPIVCSLAFGRTIDLRPIVISSAVCQSQKCLLFEAQPQDCSSPELIADKFSGVELRQRGSFGIQQDLSIRAGTFEDSRVRLNGIEINDPQTGHFSLELPITSFDLQRARLNSNANYLEFELKNPRPSGAKAVFSYGQNAFWRQGLSANFSLGKNWNNRISAEHKISSGARQDRGFDIYNFSFHSLFSPQERAEWEIFFGANQKDFGAGNFYSSFYPQEEEHTKQKFVFLKNSFSLDSSKWESTFYCRRHWDKFILDRHNPSLYTNYTTTNVYGWQEEMQFGGDFYFKTDLRRESMDSLKSGRHSRLDKGFSLGAEGLKFWGFLLDFETGCNRFLKQNLDSVKLKLRKDIGRAKFWFSFDRIWRPPSFTELYYSSPANLGNSNLSAQRFNNFEVGAEFTLGTAFNFGTDVFYKNQHDIIDWVRNSPSAAWQAENIGKADVEGVDLFLSAKPKIPWLVELKAGYTYTYLSGADKYVYSKYAGDYLRHKLVSKAELKVLGWDLSLSNRWEFPAERRQYFLWNLSLSRRISQAVLFISGENIFNRDYSELSGIKGSGRWWRIGLEYEW